MSSANIDSCCSDVTATTAVIGTSSAARNPAGYEPKHQGFEPVQKEDGGSQAAANTAVLAFKVVMIPAFVIDTVCCSMTSWIAVLSYSSILSNSSMQHTPMSASTKAPASNESYLVLGSVTIAAVRPTPELPLPVV